MNSNNITFFNITYKNRKIAKEMGAKWDKKQKKWYCDDENKTSNLSNLFCCYKNDINIIGEDRTFGGNELYIDMIPKTTYFKNVRSIFNDDDWNLIRHHIYERVNNRCECCGIKKNKYLDAHERWIFDYQTNTQKLIRIIALCRLCHQATHYGFSKRNKNISKISEHIKKVKGITEEELKIHIKNAYDIWKDKNKIKWNIDISIITNSGFEVKKEHFCSSIT